MALRFLITVDGMRFIYRPLPASQMRRIAQEVANSIRARIKAGKNVHDAAALSLTEAYLRRKNRMRLVPVRDWFWTGKVLDDIKVLRANEMKAVIGFASQFSNMVAERQNKKEMAFAASRTDYQVMLAAVTKALQNKRIINLISVDTKEGRRIQGY